MSRSIKVLFAALAAVTKTPEISIGQVQRVTVGACEGGTLTSLSSGWRVRYTSFSGTLPRITALGLNIENVAFRIEIGGSSCLTETGIVNPFRGSMTLNAELRMNQLILEEGAAIPFTGLCAPVESAHVSGTGSVTVLGETAKPIVALI